LQVVFGALLIDAFIPADICRAFDGVGAADDPAPPAECRVEVMTSGNVSQVAYCPASIGVMAGHGTGPIRLRKMGRRSRGLGAII